jgi:hypothetical protein
MQNVASDERYRTYGIGDARISLVRSQTLYPAELRARRNANAVVIDYDTAGGTSTALSGNFICGRKLPATDFRPDIRTVLAPFYSPELSGPPRRRGASLADAVGDPRENPIVIEIFMLRCPHLPINPIPVLRLDAGVRRRFR